MMMIMDIDVCFALLAMGGLRALFIIPLLFMATAYFSVWALDDLAAPSVIYSTRNTMCLAVSLRYLERASIIRMDSSCRPSP